MWNEIKNDISKSIVFVLSIVVFVVGIVVTSVNSGSTYAASYSCYQCNADSSLRIFSATEPSTDSCPSGWNKRTDLADNEATCTGKKCYQCNGDSSLMVWSSGEPSTSSCPSGWHNRTDIVSSGYCKAPTYYCYQCNADSAYKVWATAEPSTSACPSGWHKNETFNASTCIDEREVTISFDANGGTGAPSAQVVKKNNKATITSKKPSRSGYSFSKWNTKADGSGSNYKAGGSITPTKNITLYAQWTKVTVQTYAVRYDANGGTGAPVEQTKTKGEELVLSAEVPTREGYTFVSWNDVKEGTGNSYVAGATYTEDKEITLYAQWTEQTYSVKFDANGGIGVPTEQSKIYGQELTLSDVKPTREGYTFVSWNDVKEGTGNSYAAGAKYTVDKEVTLYAQWQVIEVTTEPDDKTDEEIDTNNKTGDALIYTAWIVGVGALGYSLYYFMKRKNSL